MEMTQSFGSNSYNFPSNDVWELHKSMCSKNPLSGKHHNDVFPDIDQFNCLSISSTSITKHKIVNQSSLKSRDSEFSINGKSLLVELKHRSRERAISLFNSLAIIPACC